MKTKDAMKLLVVAAVAVVGLSAPGPAPAPVANHWDRSQGGGIDLRPRLVQGSLFTGSTNAGAMPEALFWARNVSDETVQAVAERLRESASFTDEQGQGLAAVVKVAPSTTMPAYSHELRLAPSEPLRDGAWYTLTIERDLAIVVGGPEDRAEELKAAKQVRFFTGSAPQVRRIVRTADPRKPVQLDIVMSEPVELGSLVRQGLRLQAGGRELRGCVAWDSGCVRPDSTVRTNAFSFVPSSPLRDVSPTDMVLSMGANVVAVQAGAWSRCSDSDDVLCWKSR